MDLPPPCIGAIWFHSAPKPPAGGIAAGTSKLLRGSNRWDGFSARRRRRGPISESSLPISLTCSQRSMHSSSSSPRSVSQCTMRVGRMSWPIRVDGMHAKDSSVTCKACGALPSCRLAFSFVRKWRFEFSSMRRVRTTVKRPRRRKRSWKSCSVTFDDAILSAESWMAGAGSVSRLRGKEMNRCSSSTTRTFGTAWIRVATFFRLIPRYPSRTKCRIWLPTSRVDVRKSRRSVRLHFSGRATKTSNKWCRLAGSQALHTRAQWRRVTRSL